MYLLKNLKEMKQKYKKIDRWKGDEDFTKFSSSPQIKIFGY